MKRRGGVGTCLSMRTISAVAVLIAGLAVAGAPSGPSAAALAAPGSDSALPNNSAVEHSVGLVDPSQGFWHLRSPSGDETSFHYGDPGDYPFMGDWDGDGIETPGLYRQSDGYVYLRNSNDSGIADIKFFFGDPGDVPIAGDFNNDGFDTVSIYRPSNQTFYIINKLGSGDQGLGAADFSYVFGDPGDKPFVGDFDGDGVETAGLHRESTGLVYFRNSHTQGNADVQFIFGDPGDRLVAGDWTADGTFTPALFRPSNTTMYFRYTNTQGNADAQIVWGESSWLPVAGALAFDEEQPEPPPPSPPPPPQVPTVFTAAGDIGATDRTTGVLKAIAAEGADFHLAVGDLSYEELTPATAWCSYVKGLVGQDHPFQLLVGNHEDDARVNGFIRDFTPCLSDRMASKGDYGVEYYFDVGSMRVIMAAADLSVDGEFYDYNSGSHRAWLLARIDESEAAGNWTVVGVHKNCITAGIKSCEIGETMMNDMIGHGVDLILQGHDHNYQRSHQLSCAVAGTTAAACIADTDADFEAEAGTVLAITGWVGREAYDVDVDDPEAGYFEVVAGPNTAAFSEGFLTVSVSSEELRGEWTSIRGTGGDAFVIRR